MPAKLTYILYIMLVFITLYSKSGANTIASGPLRVAIPDTSSSSFGQPGYREAIEQALHFQIQADSLQRVMETHVLALSSASESEKNGIKIAIRDDQAQVIAVQKKADEWFAKVAKFEGKPAQVDSVIIQQVAEPTISTQSATATTPVVATESSPKTDVRKVPDEEFAILAKSPYSESNPIPVDQSLPEGVVYKIQLGAFSKPLAANTFKGLTPVSGEKLANGITKYYVGTFRKYDRADTALRKVHEYGYKDAYIVAFYNQKIINPERAKQLENN